MNYKLLSVFLLAFIVFACEDKEKAENDTPKEMGKLTLSRTYPQPGDSLKISYRPKKSDAYKAQMVYFVNNQFHAQDLDFKKSNDEYKSAFKIPDSANFIAFHFSENFQIDHNEHKGYVQQLFNKEQKELDGSYASKAFYYKRFENEYDYELEPDSLLTWFKKDLDNGKASNQWDVLYANMLQNSETEDSGKFIQQQLSHYKNKKELTEKDYQSYMALQGLSGNKKMEEKLKQEAIKKYPEGKIVREVYLNRMFQNSNPQYREAVFKEFLKKVKNPEKHNAKSQMAYYLASSYANMENWDKFLQYAPQIDNPIYRASLFNTTAWDLALANENQELAQKLSKESLRLLGKEQNEMLSKTSEVSELTYQDRVKFDRRMYADTYALIRFNQGDIEEALKYQRQALGTPVDPDIHERLIRYLIAAKKYKEAERLSVKYIQDNEASIKIQEYYQEIYAKNYPAKSEKDFNEHLKELRRTANSKRFEELKEEKITEKAPSFELQNMEGLPISLERYKGRVVVLDFWATWCKPCLESFPTMQEMVKTYEGNDEVVFLFINTFQDGTLEERKKEVKSFLIKNEYDFDVIFDEAISENSDEDKVAKAYGVNGIPAKVLINKEGMINFRSEGYSGSEQTLKDELNMMIEIMLTE